LAVSPARVVFTPADRAEIAAAVTEILGSGMLTLGPYTRKFESAFAAAHSRPGTDLAELPQAVAVSSGTAALEILLRAVGVSGREVIVPANTFYATAAAAARAGARLVFADMDPATFALSPAAVTAALTPQTAAVVVVHVGGLISPDVTELARLCAERGLTLIEDAAHAHGSSLHGDFAGSWGRAAAFSFYPTKVVTCGEGGMVLTGDDGYAEEARIYRDQGKGSFTLNHHVRQGYAWRMSELSAATGLVHLGRLTEAIERRRQVAARYTEGLAGLAGLTVLVEPPGSRSNFYKYIAVLPPGCDRATFKKELASGHEVRLAGEVYDVPLHQQPVFAEFGGATLPVTEDLCARHVCLPVHSDMTEAEADEVLTAVHAVYSAMAGA
jgi:perosamine synthetase